MGAFGHEAAAIVPPVADPLRVQQQHAVLLAFSRRASARPGVDVLVHDAVALVGEALHCELCGIARVDAESRGLSVEVGVLRDGRLDDVSIHRGEMAAATSLSAYALATAAPVVAAAVDTDKRFRDSFLSRMGIKSGLVAPLPVGEEPFGTIGVYQRRRYDFTLDDVRFIETIGHLLGCSIARMQAEERMGRRQILSAAKFENVAPLVVAIDLQGRIVRVNRAGCRQTGHEAGELEGTPLGNLLPHDKDRRAMEDFLTAVRLGDDGAGLQTAFLTKDGRTLQVDWTASEVSWPDGRTEMLVLAGTPQEDDDADPFALIPATPRGAEQRASPRRSFRYEQLMAPILGGSMPDRERFAAVSCRDISATGISFFVDEPPNYATLVIALGRPPALTFVSADVVRVARVDLPEGRYLVGCRFIGRVYL